MTLIDEEGHTNEAGYRLLYSMCADEAAKGKKGAKPSQRSHLHVCRVEAAIVMYKVHWRMVMLLYSLAFLLHNAKACIVFVSLYHQAGVYLCQAFANWTMYCCSWRTFLGGHRIMGRW